MSGVIGKCCDACSRQEIRQFLRLPSRAAINDAAFALVPGDKAGELTAGVALRAHGKAQVRPVEAMDEDCGRADEETAQNVPARGRVGGRCEREDLNVGERGCDFAQIEVIGTEIVPPLRNAVSLVDGQQTNARPLQHGLRIAERQPLGRGIQKSQAAI